MRRVNHNPDLLPEMQRYYCPFEILVVRLNAQVKRDCSIGLLVIILLRA